MYNSLITRVHWTSQLHGSCTYAYFYLLIRSISSSITLPTHTCRRDDVKRRHEVARTSVGSRWVWLEHRVAELNKQICRLDNIIQRRPGRENFVFATPPSSACVCSIPNGALANGGLLSVTGPHRHKGRVVNGFNHHTSSTPSFTPLLLADSVLGSRPQARHGGTERRWGKVPFISEFGNFLFLSYLPLH